MEANASKLWNKDFVLWLIGSAQSALGSALAGIALSFLVYGQTGSASAMGVTLALAMLPALLSPLAGTLVDRISLRVPLVVGNILRGLIQLGLGTLALAGPIPLELVYVLAFVNGLIGVLYGPASMSVLPNIVPKDEIPRAVGVMNSASQTANLLGLVGGGFLVGAIGHAPSLIVDGISFLVMAVLVAFVRLPARGASRSGAGFWSDFRGGLSYVRGSVLLTMLPVIALFINASLAPIEMLMPRRMAELGAGPTGLGLFLGCLTGGMIVGSLAFAALAPKIKPGRSSVAGLSALGGALLLLALGTSAAQLYGLAVLMGIALAVTNVSISTLFATLIDPEYRGRVGSLLSMVSTAGMPLTLFALAPFADALTVGTIFAASGGVAILGAGAWWLAQQAGARTATASASSAG